MYLFHESSWFFFGRRNTGIGTTTVLAFLPVSFAIIVDRFWFLLVNPFLSRKRTLVCKYITNLNQTNYYYHSRTQPSVVVRFYFIPARAYQVCCYSKTCPKVSDAQSRRTDACLCIALTTACSSRPSSCSTPVDPHLTASIRISCAASKQRYD